MGKGVPISTAPRFGPPGSPGSPLVNELCKPEYAMIGPGYEMSVETRLRINQGCVGATLSVLSPGDLQLTWTVESA